MGTRPNDKEPNPILRREHIGSSALTAEVTEVLPGGNRLVRFDYEGIFLEVLERLGKMPLVLIELGEVIEALRHGGVVRTVSRLAAFQRGLQERPCGAERRLLSRARRPDEGRAHPRS